MMGRATSCARRSDGVRSFDTLSRYTLRQGKREKTGREASAELREKHSKAASSADGPPDISNFPVDR